MARRWRDAVLDALVRETAGATSGRVLRRDLMANQLVRLVAETSSVGSTPEQTLSRELQGLRDEGLVEFGSAGECRLVRPPVYADDTELDVAELDVALDAGLLRFRDVPTATSDSLVRRRVGQDRLRARCLTAYGHRCALCDIEHPELLVCSHVVPWSEDADARGRLDNVICLCRPHDALFETGFWSLDRHLDVTRRPAAPESPPTRSGAPGPSSAAPPSSTR